jgi:hypothetical protein
MVSTTYADNLITPTRAWTFANTVDASQPTQMPECITITYTYTCSNYNFDYTAIILNEKLKMVRSGWNNPQKILIPKKSFLNNIRKCYRNQLPYKIRECA